MNPKQILLKTITMIDGAYAPATIRAYKSNFENYIKFCDRTMVAALPSSPESVAEYIEALTDSNLKSASIRIAVAAIAAIHRLNNFTDPTQNPIVKIELRRMHRKLGRESKQAYGITNSALNKMLGVTDNTLRGIRDRALILLAYDSMCRRSELVSLKIEDIICNQESSSVKIKLKRSKTDQLGSGKWLYLSPEAQAAILDWLGASKIDSGYLFRGVNKAGTLSEKLSCAQINRIYKRLARTAKLPSEVIRNISGHSMRVGAAQDLLLSGASLPVIMNRGRWSKTETVMRYVELVEYAAA